ncbi:MAG: radical SAM protein [Elusimicrobia bacterium]|nr:radical SAM protein [Elusimicrobiota bacterium]
MKKNGKKLKIVLFTGYACNNNCAFCIDEDKRGLPQKSTAELLAGIMRAGSKGADILELIGGEATIRPDFSRVVAAAKKLGIAEVACATNGRVFADMAAAKRIVASGIDSLIFSVHGPCARVHDALTRVPGSFAQLVKGLKNLKALGFKKISGNTTVVKQNLAALPELARFYAANGVRNVEYIFVDPNYGGAKRNFSALVPRISKAAPFMRRALASGRRAGMDQWKARYVPLCHFRDCLDQISEINERTLFLTEHWAPDFINTDAIGSRAAVGRRKTARCRGCLLYDQCEGIWVEYLKNYGDSELKPVKKSAAAARGLRRG